ncbi:MAG: TlpA family protein disulfide reductase [Gammaproteobacteria bacterium]
MRRWILAAALLLGAPAWAQSPKPFEADSLERIVGAHRGKPFVLMLWSMDCEFCQASLELLSKTRATHPGLTVVTVSTDPVSDAALTAQAAKRLAGLGLAEDAWAFGQASPERLRYAIDPRWRGEKPRTYWYDAQGKRVTHSGVVTAAMIASNGAP